MTYIEAAIIILNENKNQPLSANEIWERIDKGGLIKSNGKTPWASLNTLLLGASINTKIKHTRKSKPFQITGSNPYKYFIVSTDYDESNESEVLVNESISDKVLLYEITDKSIGWKVLSIYNNNETIEYEISECSEYTYIMEDKAHQTVKIGRTTNEPESRLSNLRTANPSIDILHVFPSTLHSESELHDRFDDFRKDREWFFNAKRIKDFFNNEVSKHNQILKSYHKKLELDKMESEMLNHLI